MSFFKSVQKKACHNDKDISGDDSSAEVQSTTKITDFLVVDKSISCNWVDLVVGIGLKSAFVGIGLTQNPL